jgi:hypothetical protein
MDDEFLEPEVIHEAPDANAQTNKGNATAFNLTVYAPIVLTGIDLDWAPDLIQKIIEKVRGK